MCCSGGKSRERGMSQAVLSSISHVKFVIWVSPVVIYCLVHSYSAIRLSIYHTVVSPCVRSVVLVLQPAQTGTVGGAMINRPWRREFSATRRGHGVTGGTSEAQAKVGGMRTLGNRHERTKRR